MRIAVVSDIHGNRTAFEAVLVDLRETAPDLIFHGGDLAHGGSCPAEIVDSIRDLGWPGVLGNTDEMLFRPESLTGFAAQAPAHLRAMFDVIGEMGAATREALGEARLQWLRGLPLEQSRDLVTLVHASPGNCWRSPGSAASDEELEAAYSNLERPTVVYGHIHQPYVRRLPARTIVNSGSVSMSYDGDHRASYLLLDEEAEPVIRRVAYDVDREIRALSGAGLPHSDWIARTLASARPQMP
jgi:putative phosphoesterase